jgi:putative membrane protein
MKIATTGNLLVALFSLATASLLVSADTPATTLTKADQAFIAQAALSGKSELQISQLAVAKGEKAEVKELASMIVKDHTAVNKQIADLAKTKGLQLTSAGDPNADVIVGKLEKQQTGRDFDRAYLSQLQASHKAAVAAYTDAARDSKDKDVQAWASQTLAAIQGHLDRINEAVAAL